MKKVLFLLLTVVCASAWAINYDAEYDLSSVSDDINIQGAGVYLIEGETAKYHIVVDLKENDDVVLVLKNISMDLSDDKSPISIMKGNVTIVMDGKPSTIKQNDGKNGLAAITVFADAELTFNDYKDIESTELHVSSSGEGAAIGGKGSDPAGEVNFYAGTVVARGGISGPAIGGVNNYVKTLRIGSKAKVYAYAGSDCEAPTVGGAISGTFNSTPTIQISGGYLYAESSRSFAISLVGNMDEYRPEIRITDGTVEAKAGVDYPAIGGDCLVFVDGGSIKVHGGGQAIYCEGHCLPTNISGIPLWECRVPAGVVNHSTDSSFTMTRNGAAYNYSYTGKGHKADSDLNGTVEWDDTLYFYLPFDEGTYVANRNNGDATFTCTPLEGPEIFDKFFPCYFKKDLSGSIELDLSRGSIFLSADGVNGWDVSGNRVEDVEYSNYIIVQSASTHNNIAVKSGAHTITLQGIDFRGETGVSGFDINDNCSVDLVLSGENILRAEGAPCISVVGDSVLTISEANGGGNLTCGSDSTAIGGNGDSSGQIIINSGTINCSGATGIGGGACGTGYVVINGGEIIARGSSGAGIGGGEQGAGYVKIFGGSIEAYGNTGSGIGGGQREYGNIMIYNGVVKAYSESGAGIGCGVNSSQDTRGGIWIYGGTVDARTESGVGLGGNSIGTMVCKGGSVYTFKAEGPVCPSISNRNGASHFSSAYYSVIPDAMAPVTSIFAAGDGEVTFTANKKNDSSFSYSYTGEGHEGGDNNLYFYLPTGDYTITGTNGKTFGGSVTSAGGTFTLVPEPTMFALLAIAALCLGRKRA
ncbi:hypothetical protein J5754_06765 [bacterium]|nr:hypothetical protein [bacterium]